MSKKIMIIDDSDVFRKVVAVYLKGSDYEIIEASNGEEALKKLSEMKVNLIICDVNMPVMDGLTFLTKVKSDPNNKFTPTIMLTTESQEEKKKEGMEKGAKAWLVKPFSPQQLLSAISRLII